MKAKWMKALRVLYPALVTLGLVCAHLTGVGLRFCIWAWVVAMVAMIVWAPYLAYSRHEILADFRFLRRRATSRG